MMHADPSHWLGHYRDLPALFAEQAEQAALAGERTALIDEHGRWITHAELAAIVERIAALLAQHGVQPDRAVALCAVASIEAIAAMLAVLHAGGVLVPLPLLAQAEVRARMLADSESLLLLGDAEVLATQPLPAGCAALDLATLFDAAQNCMPLRAAQREAQHRLRPPDARFAVIYSSGTTGTPKGIVQSHGQRWSGIVGGQSLGLDHAAVTLVSTPLYSNTTWVTLWPTLALGGCCVLLPKFDTLAFLRLSAQHRVSHAMLVPTQYTRLMAEPRFAEFDLSSYRMKLCTSAPFSAALKAQVLARWPGKLLEFYGLTEGGGVSLLVADEHPDKLASVGQPLPGHEFRLIDEHGREVAPGERGEIVSRGPDALLGYLGLDAATRAARWQDADGQVYLRTGDIGEFDAEGFLAVVGRRKDMIIRGGFNLYPQDIEDVLSQHPAVADAAVVGLPDAQWGEVPVACVSLRAGTTISAEALCDWVNARVSRAQRLSAVHFIDTLPRNALGKVLKQDLRDRLIRMSQGRSTTVSTARSGDSDSQVDINNGVQGIQNHEIRQTQVSAGAAAAGVGGAGEGQAGGRNSGRQLLSHAGRAGFR